MRKRTNYRPDEKVNMIRRHLIDGVQVSELCDEYELRPTLYYRWQKHFFESGLAVSMITLMEPPMFGIMAPLSGCDLAPQTEVNINSFCLLF